MSNTGDRALDETHESVYEQYVLDVRIVETTGAEEPRYRFEAPDHVGVVFDDAETATLYADVYFCTNGFVEEGTGERGVPPAVIGAGRAVLAAYLLTRPGIDRDWVASFFGKKPHRVRKYVEWVRGQADEIRAGVTERELG
ncbi:hypothetical protein C2R22_03845 [Salinigranum rubrum]|uniref:Uncharacterized protein n=1 Tax=Salinigranum rubrum TaxID=755307 RepID=A0A2I8VG38_9EURY|nr:hypothetical protein [Salinigranum rubrum]AUV80895.1 hypothetical protein C2R22_03845 [Salinigranum rubrum]